MTDTFNDRLDDLIWGERTERTAPPAAYAAVQATYSQPCSKCAGSGMTRWGTCFRCKGQKTQTFKTSPETRAANRQADANRKSKTDVETFAAFEQANPVAAAWIKAEAGKFDFATQMMAAVVRFGSLTAGQLAACERLAARNAARTEERTQRLASAPAVASEGIDRLKASFDKAIAYSAEKGLKLSPRITISGITISPAKANSKNPGALYVKSGGEYLGKIAQGRFFAVSACTPAQQDQVLGFIADPAEAAKVYGQTTGTCCICNATLISKWKHRGIGPICAEKFGW